MLELTSSEGWRQAQLWTIVAGLAVFWSIESIRVLNGPVAFRSRLSHTGNNIGIWVVGIVLLSLLAGNSYGAALNWVDSRGIGLLHFVALPGWLELIVAFLFLDLADYVFHRLSHRSRALWLLHSVHHSDPAVDVSTNLRHHPVHVVATVLWKFTAFAAIGAPLLLAMARETLVIVIAHFHHAAIAWPWWFDRSVGWLLVSPRAHWVHHSPAGGETNANFGTGLVLWDHLFGTYVDPAQPRVQRFGLDALTGRRWQSAWGMLLTPIRARKLADL